MIPCSWISCTEPAVYRVEVPFSCGDPMGNVCETHAARLRGQLVGCHDHGVLVVVTADNTRFIQLTEATS